MRVSGRRQYLIMPSWLSAKVTKTLMAYITTSASTDPRVYSSIRNEAPPIKSTPFCMVRRSLRAPKRCGKKESWARLAITRGPAMNPACAATNSSRASDAMVTITYQWPMGSGPRWKLPASICASM